MFLSRCAAQRGYSMMGLLHIIPKTSANTLTLQFERIGYVVVVRFSGLLDHLTYLSCGQMKTLVYETSVDSVEDVVARISVTAGEMRDMPGIFKNVKNPMRSLCEACVLLVEISKTFCSM
ncbi:hypothetical protein AVEN_169090-1 [Araneus ventricosus]|uniref:Uncharacterized protein n=1 Tax=Araneus ventricosus TaxID=182803 RepID=A0A4Y2MHA2_ARAVE|nr:hypothetical protein AVEN_169090-1 [Araneus ventricosus]